MYAPGRSIMVPIGTTSSKSTTLVLSSTSKQT